MQFEFTKHVLKRANDRGIDLSEIKDALESSKPVVERYNKLSVVKVFEYNRCWEGIFYREKEVKVLFVREDDKIIVITAITRYFR